MKTFQVLSLLLSYPSAALQAEAKTLKKILTSERALSPDRTSALCGFIDSLCHDDLLDVQERYVSLFDRNRALSLHLFEHVHGESRDRGQSMVDLKDRYQENGLELEGAELPDFLPVFLEFLSTLPGEKGRETLAEPLHIIAAIRTRLVERKNPYADIFLALEELAGKSVSRDKVDVILNEEPDIDPDDHEALDAIWEEQEVRFGPDDGGGECPKMKNILETMNQEIKTGPEEQNHG